MLSKEQPSGQKRSIFDTPLFSNVYELYKTLHILSAQIPKFQRYTIWQKCQSKALELLEALISMSHQRDRTHLYRMSDQLDTLKVFVRLAKDTHAIDSKKYVNLQSKLQEIGRMIGGWIKFASP